MQSVISGNVYDKYGSSNPIVRAMMARFFLSMEALLSPLSVKSILEIGCGEGEIGSRLTGLFPGAAYQGYDVAPDIIEEARRRFSHLSFDALSVYDLPRLKASADLIVASEVLEHLEDPDLAMRSLLGVHFRYLLVSVPREPVWRVLNVMRGKYLSRLGNTPGHVNHWSKKSFCGFLGGFVPELEIESVESPFPWTMALLRRNPISRFLPEV